ncbi:MULTISPECIES: phosphoribosylglycinamide formyltransferase [Campylobacter]|uniref:phosphoribosylglycinamide formyltransferase n=1 Tax=Campylobacter TaxID=194 RepID=UPI0014701EC7|nr:MULTISPECIES: phosphoribosylglycinamide formyltransferase [Campylobacter]MBN7288095.1 phosphoribosylglycinamide formyltransferase [Campylobacter curvus]MDU6828012.1 phosphoribosylglycinamide formyltransferase [Campylobacter sp.]
MPTKKIAVLFSGSGSNLEAILSQLHGKIFNGVRLEVALTLTNKADAYGIERARKYGLTSVVIENKNFASREEFDAALVNEIKKYDVDLVVLAGFMRILSEIFTSQIRAINLHPSILPLFKGAHAIKESFASDMQIGGVSVHWVSAELDGGKIIAQRAFEREDGMNEQEWEAKIHAIEHEILPQSIVKILCK